MREAAESTAPTPAEFRSAVVPLGRPAVLRGAGAKWPLVNAGRHGAERAALMLSSRSSNAPVDVIRTEPENEGRFHYAPEGRTLNFVRGRRDLDRYPRFVAALAVGEEAELAPGDASFIPKDWFHHVESLESFNMLANFWWDSAGDR